MSQFFPGSIKESALCTGLSLGVSKPKGTAHLSSSTCLLRAMHHANSSKGLPWRRPVPPLSPVYLARLSQLCRKSVGYQVKPDWETMKVTYHQHAELAESRGHGLHCRLTT